MSAPIAPVLSVCPPASRRASALAVSGWADGVFPRYLGWIGALVVADLITKAAATAWLRDGRFVELTDRLGFTLLYNTAGAGGSTVGSHTWLVNVLLTMLALLLVAWVVQPLSAVHRGAVVALASVCAGALGNLLSMLFGPAGVCDFFALTLTPELTIVMNLADLELWAGALMLAPVVRHLLRVIRVQGRSTPVSAVIQLG